MDGIGVTGFGGPPTHIALLRRLVVEREQWIDQREFEDALAGCNLLPGPASTQLAIFLARRVAGPWGAVVGGLGFIMPAVVLIILLSVVFLGESPPVWVRGLGAGAGAAVAAVAVSAAASLAGPSLKRTSRRERWFVYVVLGLASAALIGRYLVLVLLGCGLIELGIARGFGDRSRLQQLGPGDCAPRRGGRRRGWLGDCMGRVQGRSAVVRRRLPDHPPDAGDAVHTYHWMTSSSSWMRSRSARSPLARSSPPLPQSATRRTASAAGLSRHSSRPAVVPVCADRRRSVRARADESAGAGVSRRRRPGGDRRIFGAAIPLTAALRETWEFVVLGLAAIALLLLRRSIVLTLVGAAIVGMVLALAGAPVPR